MSQVEILISKALNDLDSQALRQAFDLAVEQGDLTNLEAIASAAYRLETDAFLAEVVAWLQSNAPENAAMYTHLGFIARSNGELDLALEMFQKAHHLDPQYSRVIVGLGLIAMEEEDFQTASLKFLEAIRIDEYNARFPESFIAAGIAYLGMRDVESAFKNLKKGTEKIPRDFEGHYQIATLYLHLGDFKNACRHLSNVLRYRPNHPQAVARIRQILLQVGPEFEDLQEVLQQSAVEVNNVPGLIAMAEMSLDIGDLRLVELYADSACRLEPANQSAQALLTHSILEEDPDQALEAFHSELSLEPGNPYAAWGIAKLAMDSGHYQDAVEKLEPCLKRFSHLASYHDDLATCFEQLGDEKAAEAHRYTADVLREED